MYSISAEALALFKKNYRQVVNITVRCTDNTSFTLTEANILQGGFSIDRYSLSGTKIEIGSAVSAELKLKLDNRDDRFADTLFEGAELEVKVGIKKWDALKWENAQVHWIPCGFFTVDDPPRKLASINLTALDRMVKFDIPIADNLFPTNISNLLSMCCTACGVTLHTNPSTLPNSDYMVTYTPDEEVELTYRQIIQWIAEITGTCAYVDWDGKLRLEWYKSTTTNIVASDRYSSDLYENDITITGVQITDNDDNIHLAGTDDYAFHIIGNNLLTHDHNSVVAALYEVLGGFTYRPYSCVVKPMPHLYPLDCITYTDKNGVEHDSIITHCTFKLNNSTSLAGKGETNKKNAYAMGNPLSKQESIVIKRIKKKMEDGDAYVTQQFTAADGVLNSLIEAEVIRASGEEESLGSRITQTVTSIESEVTRATAAEGSLSSLISQTAESITAEVTRATSAESSLSTRITANATSITAEVTRATAAEGSLSSSLSLLATAISAKVSSTGGTASSFAWSLTASGFSLISNNTTVMSVTSSGLDVKGKITALSGSVGGFTISSNNLFSSNSLLGIVYDGNGYHPTFALGSWSGNTFTPVSMIIDNLVSSYYGNFTELNTTRLSISESIECYSVRVSRLLAPSDVSSTTGLYFGYSGGSTSYRAVLSWSKGSRILYLKIYNSAGTQVNLTESKTFTVHYACIWGGDTTWYATVGAGSSSTSKDTSAFWGIDYARFDSSSGSSTKYFTVSGSPPANVITCRGDFVPYFANSSDLGSETYYWKNIFTQTAPTVMSDRNMKNTILPISDIYTTIFDALSPVTYKFNENTNNRTHIGLIAQDLKAAILSAGLTTQDMAAYCEWIDEFGNTGCGIRYEEIIALCIKEIQALKQKVTILESKGGTA